MNFLKLEKKPTDVQILEELKKSNKLLEAGLEAIYEVLVKGISEAQEQIKEEK